MKRKKSFMLLEVLLAFTFISAILTFLMTTFFSSIKLTTKMHVIKEIIFSRFHTHQRLSLLFSKIEPCLEPFLERRQSAFYTQKNSLYFALKQEIDPELLFSGFLLGKLYLENEALYLELSPLEEKEPRPIRKEKLLDGILSIDYTFYKRISFLPTDSKALKEEQILHEWSVDYPDIPYSMTILLKLKDGSFLDYSFHLSSKMQQISYRPL